MGIINYLAGGLDWLIQYVVGITNSYGLAIILVTIFIRLLLYPLTLTQTKSMAAMKVLQPKMTELKEKYKDDPKEYQQRSMELYKENKVNPLGGCFPMLLQLPVLFAFFRVLQDIPEGAATQFLGIWDLSQSDPYYVLPLLAAATTFIQTKMTSTDPSQKSMLYIMPVMIGVFSINFPAGLVLYWVVSNLFSIGQQAWIAKNYPVPGQGGQAK